VTLCAAESETAHDIDVHLHVEQCCVCASACRGVRVCMFVSSVLAQVSVLLPIMLQRRYSLVAIGSVLVRKNALNDVVRSHR
jgi:hypothetical protein